MYLTQNDNIINKEWTGKEVIMAYFIRLLSGGMRETLERFQSE
jgi:hypothetical protein